MGNITGQFHRTSGTMTLASAGAMATLDQWQSALRAVAYSNLSNNPDTTTRNVAFTVDDGGALNNISNTLAATITIGAGFAAPQITGLSSQTVKPGEAWEAWGHSTFVRHD